MFEHPRVAELYQSESLRLAVFNNINTSNIATDETGTIRLFNLGAQRMLGYQAHEVVNKLTPADMSDPQELKQRACALSAELDATVAPGFDALVCKASRTTEDCYALTYIRKDGSRCPAVVRVTALRDAFDNLMGYLLIGNENAREVARQAAEEACQVKSAFLTSISHELRTPLNAILGFAQLMECGPPVPTERQRSRLQQIAKAGWGQLELINEMLELAVIGSGKLALSLEPVCLEEMLTECCELVEPYAKNRGISVTLHPTPASWFVQVDRTRAKQALINLLSNAITYNHPHGTVDLFSTSTADRVCISVKDSGTGLSAEQLRQLFEPFNRLGQEHGTDGGTGIGLVVSKELVERMGGNISVKSQPGQGSEFDIEWVRAVAPSPVVEHGTANIGLPDIHANGEAHPRTMLYVDDDPANLLLIEQIMECQPNVRLLCAFDVNMAMMFARAHMPDVIVMDINLPGIGGIAALKMLKADAATAHIPIIALAANTRLGDIQCGLDAGFFRYLAKPLRINDLLCALHDSAKCTAQLKRHDDVHPFKPGRPKGLSSRGRDTRATFRKPK